MKKLLMVLVGVLGVAGLVAVASAHMGGGGYAGPQGYGSGYGWSGGMGPGAMHQGMGSGWMGPGMMGQGSGMGPGAMRSDSGGWMSWMGNMFGSNRTPHRGYDRGPTTNTPHVVAPDSNTR